MVYPNQINKKSRKTGLIFAISAFVLIIVVLGFTGGLNISSFQQKYEESVVGSFVVPSEQMISKIEYAVKYGKEISNFYGMEGMLTELLIELPEVNGVQISLPNGDMVYNQAGPIEHKESVGSIIKNVRESFSTSNESDGGRVTPKKYVLSLEHEEYKVFLPIYNNYGSWIGSLSLTFDKEVVSSRTWEYLSMLIQYLIILALLAAVILGIYAFTFSFINEEGKFKRKQVLVFTIIILSVIQIIYGWLNYNLFSQAYIEASEEVAFSTANSIQKDITSVLDKGVPYDKFYQFDEYLERVLQTLPAIGHVTLIDEEQLLFSSNSDLSYDQINLESDFVHLTDLSIDRTGVQPKMSVHLSESFIKKQLQAIILDTLTVLVTSILFMIEIAILVILFLSKGISRKDTTPDEFESDNTEGLSKDRGLRGLKDTAIVRPLSFIFHTAIFFSAAFIPIMSKQLYEPLWGLSQNFIIALPITLEMFGAGLGIILAGIWVDKKGWKPIFLFGAISAILGMYVSSSESNSILSFSLARGLAGLGYGTSFMALRGLVTMASTEKQRTEGLTSFFAGLYAGVNCGIIVGAMLADRIGYFDVFKIALIVVGITTLVVIFSMKNVVSVSLTHTQSGKAIKGSLLRFISNRQVIAFLVLIALPIAVCNMFLDYYFPIFADNAGISTSDVGRAFLVNGLIIVYLAPLLSRYCLHWFGVEKALLYSGLLVALGMLIFGFYGSLLAAFIAVILLGIADSFGLVAQNKYYINLKATGEMGTGKALGYYDNIRKVGQMVGPVIFGGLIIFGDIGISFLGLLFILMLIFFWWTSVRQTRIVAEVEGISNETKM